MSTTLRTSTENKHEPLLARLMKWRPVSPAEEAEKQVTLLLANAVAGSPSTNWCSQTCVELVHAAKRGAKADLRAPVSPTRQVIASPHRRVGVGLISHCTYGGGRPLPRLAFCAGSNDVPKPEFGVKRQCTNCGAKFFDLMKSPIVCPKCGTVYEVPSITARRELAAER